MGGIPARDGSGAMADTDTTTTPIGIKNGPGGRTAAQFLAGTCTGDGAGNCTPSLRTGTIGTVARTAGTGATADRKAREVARECRPTQGKGMTLIPSRRRIFLLSACVLLLWCATQVSPAWSLPRAATKGINQCLRTYSVAAGGAHHRRAYDLCNVRRGFFSGRDRGWRRGRQLEVVDVVRQLRDHFRHDSGAVHSRKMARDLNRCLRSYSVGPRRYGSRPDRCRVRPSRATARYWGLEPGRKTSVELPRTLRAVLRFAAHRDRDCRRRHGRAAPFGCGKPYRLGRDLPEYQAPVSRPIPLSRTCRYHSGPKAGTTQYFPLWVPIVPGAVGSPCWDGLGSFGVAVRHPM